MPELTKKRLTLVQEKEELVGTTPPLFERMARSATPGSRDHRALVAICTALARACLTTSVPPSAQRELLAAIRTAHTWLSGSSSNQQVKQARIRCFQALPQIEALTASAIEKASAHLSVEAPTDLDPHADHVVKRYATLAAHFTVSALCHTLDAIEKPEVATEVLGEIEGAHAYLATGLGSARHPAFRKAALHQAQWESAKQGLKIGSDEDSRLLAVQVFHEYLGGRWQAQVVRQRQKNNDFVDWALSGRPRARLK